MILGESCFLVQFEMGTACLGMQMGRGLPFKTLATEGGNHFNAQIEVLVLVSGNTLTTS